MGSGWAIRMGKDCGMRDAVLTVMAGIPHGSRWTTKDLAAAVSQATGEDPVACSRWISRHASDLPGGRRDGEPFKLYGRMVRHWTWGRYNPDSPPSTPIMSSGPAAGVVDDEFREEIAEIKAAIRGINMMLAPLLAGVRRIEGCLGTAPPLPSKEDQARRLALFTQEEADEEF